MRLFPSIIQLFVLLSLVISCGGPASEKRDETEIQYSPEIAKIISSATAGSILPDDKIEVLFNNTIVAREELKKEIENPFDFTPSISGKAYWAGLDKLVFEPSEPLNTRVNYSGTLHLKAVRSSFELEDFSFKFYVEGRELVSFNGDLALYNPSNPKQLVYEGKVVFSQKTSLEDVKDAAYFSSGELNWSQEGDETFTFVSPLITRETETKTYDFSLSGSKLDLESDLDRSVKVVPLKSMELTSVEKDESGKKPQFMLKFSDQLDKDQNLDGFVSIEPQVDFTTQKMGKFLVVNGDFKFGSTYEVTVQPGLRSKWGTKTDQEVFSVVTFKDVQPQVQFSSNGIFMPTSNEKNLQFLTANLKRVHVEVKKVFSGNMERFFRNEKLNSKKDRNVEFRNTYISSVGAIIYNQTLEIGGEKNEWLLHNLDLSRAFKEYKNGLYLIRINFNPQDLMVETEESKSLSYIQEKGQIYKPVTISDIGMIAKYSSGRYKVFTTDIRTGQPLSGVTITTNKYGDEYTATTNSYGTASLSGSNSYLIKAEKGDQVSIIKPNEMKWNESGFDVGGVSASSLSTRAYIYTERGVYRPGDSINLSCIVRYSSGQMDNVPADLRLYNPEGTMVYETTEKNAKDGFYNFKLGTDLNAPTGNWNAVVQTGSKYFYHDLKIETIVANRLKVKVASSLKEVLPEHKGITISVESRFLFGTPSPGLSYDTEVQVFDISNPFPEFSNFTFKNKSVDFQRSRKKIRSGTLDEEGKARINWNIPNLKSAATPLKAKLTATVQEEGGRPNDSWSYVSIHPFSHYVGIDNSNSYIRLNSQTDIPVVVVDHKGRSVAGRELAYRIYRNDHHWWYQYDSYRDFKMRFKTDTHTHLVEEGVISSGKPYGQLPFLPRQKGRYLIEVQDAIYQGHTSSVFLSAYPYGSVPSGDQNSGTLVLRSEKDSYKVGEAAKISFPSPGAGNILLTVEQGQEIIDHEWIEPDLAVGDNMTVSLDITPEMTPNVYVTVTVLQPHDQTVNDRPIRMFGILPLKVVNEETIEELVIDMPDELRPKQKFDVDIRTTSGRPTQFTVAVVDEGLLDLTNFKTPDPWKEFFKKIRLGVKTYDLFGSIIGANEGDVFKTFSIGGDEDYRESQLDPFEKKKRFKPVCMFEGPVQTDANGKASVSFEMPNYVGSVRVMVVSAKDDSYGSAEKTVPVKSDLIVLPTIPRALKPGDAFKVPVNVFATKDNVGSVNIQVETEGPVEVMGATSRQHTFDTESDQFFYFDLKTKEAVGQAKIRIVAKGKGAQSVYEADVAVSPAAARVYEKEEKVIRPGETLTFDLPKLGLDGTNNARLHLAVFPNLDFTHRLDWLIRYPYGCIEQTTSSVYPQLALKDFLKDDERLAKEIDANINAGIDRLRLFQLSNGGFSYWPGGNEASPWGSNYAGQFLIEARRMGYAVPDGMYDGIIRYLQRQTKRTSNDTKYLTTRVNRCFVLALADEAPLNEMNLLMQNHYDKMSNTHKWMLVAAYKLAGAFDKVQDRVGQIETEVEAYKGSSWSYGSRHRDLGLILRCLVVLERKEEADIMAKYLTKELSRRYWYATQTLGQMLLGVGHYFEYAGINASNELVIEGEVVLPGGDKVPFKEANKVAMYINEGYGGKLKVSLKEDVKSQLYCTLSSNGVPLTDRTKDVDQNIKVTVDWFDEDGQNIDVGSVRQGDVFYGRYRVSNVSVVPFIDEVALVQLLPSGWEIENTRLSGELMPDWMESLNTGQEEYVDIRDDRIMWFFDLSKNPNDFVVKINAITEGTYTLPGVRCEAMYDNDYLSTKEARPVIVQSKK